MPSGNDKKQAYRPAAAPIALAPRRPKLGTNPPEETMRGPVTAATVPLNVEPLPRRTTDNTRAGGPPAHRNANETSAAAAPGPREPNVAIE
jgi:hypothetical protein